MQETGKVIEVMDTLVKIEMKRSEACDHCSGGCKPSEDKNHMIVEAVNRMKASVGDRVVIDLPTSSVLKATLLVYIIPLLALILGVVIGYFLHDRLGFGDRDLASASIGLIFVALAFLVIKMFEPYFKKKNQYLPIVTKIIRD